MKTYPLTESMSGVFLSWNEDRSTTTYNICATYRLPSTVDLARLDRAIRAYVALHPMCRARLFETDEGVRWGIEPSWTITLQEAPSFEIRPFDPFNEPLMRCVLVRQNETCELSIEFFHLISDGTSITRFYHDLGALYRGEEVAGEEISFADYAEAEKTTFTTDEYREVSAAYRKRFEGKSMTQVPAPTESDAPAASFYAVTATMPRAPIEAFCRATNVSVNLFFMGAFARTLSLFADTNEVVFYTANHGRPEARLKATQGLFVKPVPILATLEAAMNVSDFLSSLKPHKVQVYPFTHFCRDLAMRPGWAMVYQVGTVDFDLELEGEMIHPYIGTSDGAGRMPLFKVASDETSFNLRLTVLSGVYGPRFLKSFLDRLVIVATNLAASPTARLGEVSTLRADELRSVLETLSRGTPLATPRETLVDRVDALAAARPTDRAVVDVKHALTWGELKVQASTLATRLAEAGVAPGEFVGLMLPRRTSFIAALLAVQRCGAGYVPMDAEYPADRLAYMLSNSEAKVLITTAALLEGKNLDFKGRVLLVENELSRLVETEFPSRATPDTPAYMIYTSGSTGRPKGVVLANRALSHLCAWTRECFRLTPERAVATHPSFSFDASVIDIFPALSAGATLHLFDEETRKDLAALRAYIEREGIWGGTMSTQIGMALLDAYPDLPLNYLMVGGEKLLPTAKTRVRILNGYGPTEFAVCSSCEEVDQSLSGDIPIGRPVPGTASVILDRLGQPVPAGFIGELALAGPQISEGYWHLPEKTAAVFITPTWAQNEGVFARYYRTGDLARYRADGKLEYAGRLDFQVKLRGFRIEMGEVEHAAKMVAGVKEVAAEVRSVAGTQHLVLYYSRVHTEEPSEAFSETLRAKMSETLTGYMVPDYFVEVEPMPMTPNGKIDRKRLETPTAEAGPIEPPTSACEKSLFAILSDILKMDNFGVTHDFNRLGLTSLGAMTFVARVRATMGAKVTLGELVKNPTLRSLAACLESRGGATAPSAATPSARRRPRRAHYPLTENQRGIYTDWLRAEGTTQYNVPAVFRFPAEDPAALAAAAEKVFAAHPVLRTTFGEKDGEIVQVRGSDPIRVAVVQLPEGVSPDSKFFAEEMRPFAPQGEPLARGRVYAAKEASYLFLDIHHTIFDGVSVGVFLADLMSVLSGGEIPEECLSAYDVALEERDYLESESAEADEQWFASYVGETESTRFETSSSGAGGAPGAAGRVAAQVPSEPIAARCQALGVTASDYFLTTFTELLRRVGRADEVLINFVSAGRQDVELARTIGMFVKTLPVKGASQAQTFTEAVRTIHASVAEIIDRDRVSYAHLAEKCGVRPEILFAFEGGIFDLPRGATLVPCDPDTVKAPLAVIVTPKGDAFELKLEYDAALYSEADMRALVEMFAFLARGFVEERASLRAYPLVDEKTAAELMTLHYGGDIAYDASRTFVNLVAANVIARPFATAVVDAEGALTYGELAAESDALASELRSRGVAPGGFVGLMLPRGRNFIVAMLAVQKCGAGYVPMDAEYPGDRLAYMLENSGAVALVTTRSLFSGKNLDYAGAILFADEARLETAAITEGGGAINLSTPTTPAYMIYTSGSTGRPKGVVISQRAVRHFCAWTMKVMQLDYSSQVATHPSFSFDASVADLFPTLAAGATLHIYPESLRKDLEGLRQYILDHQITGGTMSTQMGMVLLDTYPDLPLKYLLVGGEKLLPTAPTKVRILNGYGPTEFTVASSYECVNQNETGDIPIGRPVPGTYSHIVDKYGHLLPRGFTGELALAGPQLSEGYWRLPEKTASVFVAQPFEESRGAGRMYRTGDLARYRADGRLDYQGRLDFQVKLRGFRIEIGEVEHAAKAFSGVKEVVADVREVAGVKHLILYYGSEKPLDEAALRASMAARLTDYMVPDYFVRLDPMPLTPNGKINRRLLPTPSDAAVGEFVEPANDEERLIAETYATILKHTPYGATDDFFATGGTSLVAIKAVVALQRAGLEVTYGDLFRYKTPRALAAFVRKEPAPSASVADAATPTAVSDFGAYDYAHIDALLAATPTELFEGFRRHSLGDVLLTGATGYLGIHILRHLLETTDATVYALVRPRKGLAAARRLDTQYVYYFGERLPRRYRERLAIVTGDITDADLASTLADVTVGTVINCAALVKHYVADDAMERINVKGVENLLAWCEKTGARLVQTSTYSVGGTVRATTGAVLHERTLYLGQTSDNAYVSTKFRAERAVLEATAAGRVRGKVMRLGNLMGRESDGEFQMNVGANAFVNSLKSYRALGVYPLEALVEKIEMSPIDRVAEAVCLLATTPDSMTVFHPFNCYRLDMGAVIAALNRRGWAIDAVSRPEFAREIEALKANPARANELQGVLHYAMRLAADERITPVENDWTTTVLYRLGFRWRAADDTYLANFFEMLDGLAVFD